MSLFGMDLQSYMSSFDANNPDHLLVLVSGIWKISKEERRASKASRRDILDSLAKLAICKEKGQTIAIGAVETEGHLELVVAENGQVDESVRPFLEELLSSLAAIFPNPFPVVTSTFPPTEIAGDTKLVERLDELEISVFLHNFPKVRDRFTKHYERFQIFLTHLNKDKPSYLMERKDKIDTMGKLISRINDLFEAISRSDSEENAIRFFIPSIHEIIHALYDLFVVGERELLDDCTAYIKSANILRDVDISRWLSKLATTHLHFERVSQMAIQRGFLLKHPIRVITLDNVPTPRSFTLTRASFVALMQDCGWTPHSERGLNEGELFDAWREVLASRIYNSVNVVKSDDSDEMVFHIDAIAHAECIVLENLKNRANTSSENPMSRVGASKVSCTPCAIYYALQGSTFHTNGSHSQFPPTWQCPSDDPEIREEMCIRLRQELIKRARLFETQTLQRQPRRIGPNSKPKATKEWNSDEVLKKTWDFIEKMKQRQGLTEEMIQHAYGGIDDEERLVYYPFETSVI